MHTLRILRRKLIEKIAALPDAHAIPTHDTLRSWANSEWSTFSICNLTDEEFELLACLVHRSE